MQREEGSPKTGREGRLRLRNAAFCSGQLAGVTGEEIIHCLIRREYRNWRQDSVGISRKENNFLGGRSFGDRFNDVFDVIDRIGNTSVFSS